MRTIVDGDVTTSTATTTNGGLRHQRSEEQHMVGGGGGGGGGTRVATVSPTRKPQSIPGSRASALMTVSTRKIGKKLELELTKGPAGLGFSVTTRDNPAGGLCPIYIKNILPKGIIGSVQARKFGFVLT